MHPLSAVMILNKVEGWDTLSVDEGKTIVAATSDLIAKAKLSGLVEDQDIDARLGQLNLQRRSIKLMIMLTINGRCG